MKLLHQPEEAICAAVRSGEVSIAVFGLGKMGLPLAVAFAEVGARVLGIDPNRALVETVNRGRNPHSFETGLDKRIPSLVQSAHLHAFSDPQPADIYITLVPTVLDAQNRPDLTTLETVFRSIASLLQPGDLVIEESTLPPGTCAQRLWPILKQSGLSSGEFGFAHAPERTMSGRALEDITGAYPKIVGGIDLRSTEAAAALYAVINRKGVIPVSSITAAEAVKVFEGIYRDANIALANELALLCRRFGLDAIETIDAANTQPYCRIHTPGAGVGGHCIPVYPRFVTPYPEAELIRAARKRNEEMPRILVQMTLEELERQGVPPSEAKVALLGIAFRPGVKEDRYSPFFSARDVLQEQGADVYAWDFLYTDDEIRALGVAPVRSLEGMDAAILITAHEEFRALDWRKETQAMRRPVVVDGRFAVPLELRATGTRLIRIDGA